MEKENSSLVLQAMCGTEGGWFLPIVNRYSLDFSMAMEWIFNFLLKNICLDLRKLFFSLSKDAKLYPQTANSDYLLTHQHYREVAYLLCRTEGEFK